MTQPLFNIGGLASGLDTNSIISQLMDIERIPKTQLQQRQSTYQARISAWQTVSTRFSALNTAVTALRGVSDFSAFVKTTSSNPDAVAVTSGSGATAGVVSFTVDNLATAHQAASAGTWTGTGALVGEGTFTITVGSQDYDFTTTAGSTLSTLAKDISASGAGVNATVVSVDGTNYKLLLTSKQTGASNSFVASGDQTGLESTSLVQQGLDAQLTIGSGAGALTVTRSSNVITDLVSGTTITLKKESASPVTITVDRDVDAAAAAIKKMVDEVNSTIKTLADLTKYDATSKTAGVLQGDFTARTLASDLRTAVSDIVAQLDGSYRFASSVGITLQRDGSFALDETKLKAALSSDFDGVVGLFARSGIASDSRVEFVHAAARTEPGSYAVEITSAASVARATGAEYVSPPVDEAFTVIVNGKTIAITVPSGASIEDAIAAINSAIENQGITTLKASASGGAIELAESRYGSSASFTIADDDSFGLNGSYAGTDVVGTIDGEAITGTGQLLVAKTGDAEGLQLRVTATAAEVAAAGGTLSLGTIQYSEGIAGRTYDFVDRVRKAGGSISAASDRWRRQIELINDQMKAFDVRLELRERSLRQQFAAMESALSKLSVQGNWLTAQLNAQGGGSQ